MSDGAPRWRRYLRLARPNPAADVDDELSFHLEMRVERNIALGMNPNDALPAGATRDPRGPREGAPGGLSQENFRPTCASRPATDVSLVQHIPGDPVKQFMPGRRLLVVASSFFIAAIAACAPDESVAYDSALTAQSAAMPAARDMVAKEAAGGMALGAAAPVARNANYAPPPPAPALPAPQAPAGDAPAMLIRNGDVSIRVDSLEAAMAAVRALAASLGGHIGNVSIAGGDHQVRSATLEMRIPSARFDDAMAGVAPIGRVEHSSTTAHDVGEEFVDVTARITTAKKLEERLVSLLATRTGKLEDVLAVERELARVRGEIERYEGRIRYLSTRVATSTIMATVHEREPLVASQPGENILQRAVVNMWRNFVFFIARAIEALGILVPLAVLGWIAFVIWRRRLRATPSATA